MERGLETDADGAHHAVRMRIPLQGVVVLHADVEAVVSVAQTRAGVEGVAGGFAAVTVDDPRVIADGHAGGAVVVDEVVAVANVALNGEAAAIREIDGVLGRQFNRQQQGFLLRAVGEVEVGPEGIRHPSGVRFGAAVPD